MRWKKNKKNKKKPTKWERNEKLTALKFMVPVVPAGCLHSQCTSQKSPAQLLELFQVDLQQPPKAGVTHLLLRQKRHHQQTLITPSVTVGHYAWLWVHLQKYINNQDTNTGRIPRSLNCRVICVGRKSMGKRRYGDPGLGDLIGTEGAHGRKKKETGSVLWAEHCASQGCTLKSLPGPSVKWARLQGDRLQTAPLPRD